LRVPPRIKNCGLSTPESIDQAANTGASFVGFVHHAKSPRHLELPAMAALIAHTRKHTQLKTVAVLVDPDDALLTSITREVEPDFIQLHDVGSPSRITDIREQWAASIITAISVRGPADLASVELLDAVSAHLLFDAKSPGSGQPFDWSLLTHIKPRKPWFLAGGLTPENVAEAIRITRAPMVDVSSGIESAPGQKSLEKIAAFNRAVLQPAA
jgi:phosphoribosylanthranilate isomerase